MNEVWYVMADGSVGDPAEISAGPDGVLRHTDGRAVAYKPHGPVARMIDPVAERAKAALMAGKISINEALVAVGKPPIPSKSKEEILAAMAANPPKSEAEILAQMAADPPRSPEEIRAEIAANPPNPETKEVKPAAQAGGYRTREAKAG